MDQEKTELILYHIKRDIVKNIIVINNGSVKWPQDGRLRNTTDFHTGKEQLDSQEKKSVLKILWKQSSISKGEKKKKKNFQVVYVSEDNTEAMKYELWTGTN